MKAATVGLCGLCDMQFYAEAQWHHENPPSRCEDHMSRPATNCSFVDKFM